MAFLHCRSQNRSFEWDAMGFAVAKVANSARMDQRSPLLNPAGEASIGKTDDPRNVHEGSGKGGRLSSFIPAVKGQPPLIVDSFEH